MREYICRTDKDISGKRVYLIKSELVRCKDCKWWDAETIRSNSNDFLVWEEAMCMKLLNPEGWDTDGYYRCGEDFCSYGERRNK